MYALLHIFFWTHSDEVTTHILSQSHYFVNSQAHMHTISLFHSISHLSISLYPVSPSFSLSLSLSVSIYVCLAIYVCLIMNIFDA